MNTIVPIAKYKPFALRQPENESSISLFPRQVARDPSGTLIYGLVRKKPAPSRTMQAVLPLDCIPGPHSSTSSDVFKESTLLTDPALLRQGNMQERQEERLKLYKFLTWSDQQLYKRVLKNLDSKQKQTATRIADILDGNPHGSCVGDIKRVLKPQANEDGDITVGTIQKLHVLNDKDQKTGVTITAKPPLEVVSYESGGESAANYGDLHDRACKLVAKQGTKYIYGVSSQPQ